MSVTQFIWYDCLGFESEEKSSDQSCWLCAGEVKDKGEKINSVIGAAFTDSLSAKCKSSDLICKPCAALMKKETWEQACIKFGHSPNFPIKEGKKPFLMNWMFANHVFAKGLWMMPGRKEAREILLNPPPPPFVIVLTEVGKKHIIFKASVSYSTENFLVQFDEDTIEVNAEKFKECLSDFEHAYSLGFSKESLLTGNYNQAVAMRVGIQKWRQIEETMKKWRVEQFDIVRLCNFCSQKN